MARHDWVHILSIAAVALTAVVICVVLLTLETSLRKALRLIWGLLSTISWGGFRRSPMSDEADTDQFAINPSHPAPAEGDPDRSE